MCNVYCKTRQEIIYRIKVNRSIKYDRNNYYHAVNNKYWDSMNLYARVAKSSIYLHEKYTQILKSKILSVTVHYYNSKLKTKFMLC